MRVEGRGRTRCNLGAAAALLVLSWDATAYAHGNRPDLAFYGDFGAAAARCQRIIARAASQCASAAVDARSACLSAEMGGQPCDTAAVDAQVAAAHATAQDQIQRACSEQDAGMLQFNSLAEAQADVVGACSDLGAAAVSATYGPALATGSVGSVDAMPGSCMRVTARETARLLRLATASQQQALDHIVASQLPLSQKQALLARATRRIAHAQSIAQQRIAASCSSANFTSTYSRDLDTFLTGIAQRADCVTSASFVQSAITCPSAVCGNGIQEPGEQCDDGNEYDADGCHNDCTKNNCQVFPSTFDLIQAAIFEKHGCTNDLCHGQSQQSGLDLRKDSSYTNLVDVASVESPLKRVEPGAEQRSLLWLKLAAATLGTTGVPGSPMPQGLAPLSADELEAVRLWIYGAAPRTGVVRGTADLLNACLPIPEPIQIRPPAPPDPSTGIQLHMPAWVLPPNSESEVCFASYYDVTEQVPAQFRSPDGTMFRYKQELATQDPLSHHLIANLYDGQAAPDDPVWGTYGCRGGAHDGEPCNPVNVGGCGADAECATTPVKSIACIGFGPPDNQIAFNSFGFTGTQQPVQLNDYPDGVYAELPLKGVILWNSHAFNLADKPGKEEAWLNFYFASPAEQVHPLVPLVDIDAVFAMNVAAFGTDAVCNIEVLPEGAQVFQLSSHMHKHGKRFQIFRGAFHCSGGDKSGQACSPADSSTCDGAPCVEDTGRDPASSLLYTSLIYNDPVTLRLDPPITSSGSSAARSLTYCALYDNGFTNPAEVKRKSTSPQPPFSIGFGGPCNVPTNCVSGMLRAPCKGATQKQRDASCDSSPGAGDGFCDACPLGGGVTTEDEMFVLLGSYYLQ